MTGEPESEGLTELRACRDELEGLDRELIDIISRRIAIARRTAGLKRAANLPILDPQREAVVIRNAVTHARSVGVPEEPVREIFWHIVGLSRRIQETGE